MIYGYMRVTKGTQNLYKQIQNFKTLGAEKLYADKWDGKDFEREEYQKLKKILKPCDVLIIKSIDSLGNSYDMIIDEWRMLVNDMNVDIQVLDMPLLDTRTEGKNLVGKFISDIVLQILSFVAENERENIKKRQAEGIRIAKEKGKHSGRPRLVFPDNFQELAEKYNKGEITLIEIKEKTGMSRSTISKCLRKMGLNTKHRQKRIYVTPKYRLVGKFIDKLYQTQKQLLKDLGISNETLARYFNKQNTIINKMGFEVFRI